MDIKMFRTPNVIMFGRGAATKIGTEARKLAKGSVLIVTDAAILKVGLADPIKESLEKEGFSVAMFDQVEAEPSIANVEKVIEILRKDRHSLVVGLGGGSSMDVAKSAASVAPLDGSMRDYVGVERLPVRGLPRILVATTSGTGSEVTQVAMLVDEKTGVKQKIASVKTLADVAVVDPLLCLTMPRKVTIDTGIDAFVHGFESYVSRNHGLLTDLLAMETMRIIANKLPVAVFCPEDIGAREAMASAAAFGGLSCTNAGLGAVHALTYPLTKYGFSHGLANAVMLPHVTEFNLPAAYDRYADISRSVFETDPNLTSRQAAIEVVKAVKNMLDELDVSYRLRDYGIAHDKIDEMADVAFNGGKHLLPTNPRSLSIEDVRQIYRNAW